MQRPVQFAHCWNAPSAAKSEEENIHGCICVWVSKLWSQKKETKITRRELGTNLQMPIHTSSVSMLRRVRSAPSRTAGVESAVRFNTTGSTSGNWRSMVICGQMNVKNRIWKKNRDLRNGWKEAQRLRRERGFYRQLRNRWAKSWGVIIRWIKGGKKRNQARDTWIQMEGILSRNALSSACRVSRVSYNKRVCSGYQRINERIVVCIFIHYHEAKFYIGKEGPKYLPPSLPPSLSLSLSLRLSIHLLSVTYWRRSVSLW